jgi:hypothetical protein
MQIIAKKRREGKTTELIMACAKAGGFLVCATQRDAHHTASIAKHLDISVPYPLTYHEFLEGRYYGSGVKVLFIDDADRLLQYLSKTPIGGISISTDTEKPS